MRWNDLVEMRIREARSLGLFDRLRGRGRPAADDELANLAEDDRMAARIAVSVGAVPPEVERMAEVDRLRAELAAATTDEARTELRRALRKAEIERNVLLERTGRSMLLYANLWVP